MKLKVYWLFGLWGNNTGLFSYEMPEINRVYMGKLKRPNLSHIFELAAALLNTVFKLIIDINGCQIL
jgi:ADP-heptose:LPS heptosyltransferase